MGQQGCKAGTGGGREPFQCTSSFPRNALSQPADGGSTSKPTATPHKQIAPPRVAAMLEPTSWNSCGDASPRSPISSSRRACLLRCPQSRRREQRYVRRSSVHGDGRWWRRCRLRSSRARTDEPPGSSSRSGGARQCCRGGSTRRRRGRHHRRFVELLLRRGLSSSTSKRRPTLARTAKRRSAFVGVRGCRRRTHPRAWGSRRFKWIYHSTSEHSG